MHLLTFFDQASDYAISSVLINRLQPTIVLSLSLFFFLRMSYSCSPVATNSDLSHGVPTFMSQHENINIFTPGFTFRVVFSVEGGLLFFPFTVLFACQ